MRIAVGAPSSGRLRRSRRMLSAFIASPVFTASGTPCSATIVGPVAPQLAAVLDVVVHEEGVVQHLERRSRGHRVRLFPAEGLRRGDAQRGPDALPGARQVRRDQIVEVTARLVRGQRSVDLGEREIAPSRELALEVSSLASLKSSEPQRACTLEFRLRTALVAPHAEQRKL